MNGTNVSNTILERLAGELSELTPEARKAATYVLENPRDVGVSTVREIAEAANVKPNTILRMASQVGFEGYEDFRAPFRDAIRRGAADFPDRARWLQDIRKSGHLGGLYADMARDALANVEETFANISTDELKAAADAIWTARRVLTLGVGVNNSLARNFTYLASTGMTEFHAIPRPGSTPVDDLAWADRRDVLGASHFLVMRLRRRQALQSRKSGQRLFSKQHLTASTALAPAFDQWRPAPLSRLPTMRLQALSTKPDPTGRPRFR